MSGTVHYVSLLGRNHFRVPDNQISLHFEVPDNCSLKSSGGVRQSRSLANGSTPQTEEHWGSPNKLRSTTLLYIVHCTLYTVYCTLYTFHCTLFPANFSTQLSTQLFTIFFHTTLPHIFFTSVFNQIFHPSFQPIFPPNCSTLFFHRIFQPTLP